MSTTITDAQARAQVDMALEDVRTVIKRQRDYIQRAEGLLALAIELEQELMRRESELKGFGA